MSAGEHGALRGPPAFVRAMDRLSLVFAVAAAAFLTLAALIVTWLVIYRWLGNSAYWELEAAIYLMVAAVFLGSPYCLRTRGHVSVDLAFALLPPGTSRRVLERAILVLGFLTCLYLAWVGGRLAWHAFATGEGSGSLWNPPRWPLYVSMPIGLGFTAAQYVAEWLRPGARPESAP